MGDVGNSRDGRLELDELGGVLDQATDLGSRSRDDAPDLVEGAAGPSWAERFESIGITGYLRRHRVALVLAATVVIVATGASAAYLHSRPAVDDGVIALSIVDSALNEAGLPYVTNGEAGTFTYAYQLNPDRPGDSVRVLGLVGPGIRASSASGGSAQSGAPVTDTVIVVPGCDDPAALTATSIDYSLLIERTDSQGRTVTGTKPVPPGSGVAWQQSLGGNCVRQAFAESITTESITVNWDNVHHEITLAFQVHNGLSDRVTISGGLNSATLLGAVSTTTVPAGTTAAVRMSARVVDCSGPTLDQVYAPDVNKGVFGTETYGELETPGQATQPLSGPLILHWSQARQHRIQAALDGMCAGMPLTSVRVVSADLAVNRALSAGFAASRNYNDVVVLRSRVFVSSTADQVTMGDTLTAQDSANGAAASLSSASGRVVAGRVGLAIDWAVSCSDYPSPPQVRLTLTSHNATFPGRASLTDETLAQAFLAACPTRTRQDLSDAGWPLPGS